MPGTNQDKATQKLSTIAHIEENSFQDEGDGVISFPYGQVISDESKQRNGTRYDIASMEIEEFNGTVTADHYDMIQSVVAKTIGLAKRGNQLIINGLQFAVKESAFAQLTYDLMRGGYVKDLSIETYGPWPDSEDQVYKDAKLCGLSVVVTGNNKSATVNSLVQNSLATARKNGLDTTEAEEALGVKKPEEADKPTNNAKKEEDEMSYKTIKNGRDFAIKVTYKNAAGEATETELAPGKSVDVAEDQATNVEKQISDAEAPKQEAVDVNAIKADLKAEMEKDFEKRMESFQKKLADEAAVEPTFKIGNSTKAKHTNGIKGSELGNMDWKERTALQLQSIRGSFAGDREASALAHAINQFHLEDLQSAGIVSNALDLPDLGNFVIPKEMVKEIKEQPSNYRPLLDVFRFDETMSLETAMLKGTGEIEMEDVDMDDNGDDGDLKPIKKPTFGTESQRLYEFAAVTPVKSSAIRFAAVDLVQHLTRLYKRAYDRRLAQSVIGRLELAVEANGNSVPYNYSSAAGGNVEALVTLITAWAEIAEHTPGGVFILTESSRLHLLAMALRAGTNGPLAGIFTNDSTGVRFLGKPYVVVPGDIMPNLNTAATKSWTFEGESVTVNHGVLLADPADFVGKVSGGLNFQVSDVASYEVENGGLKSAFQRDELVFRGYGYRSSGLYFEENVAGVSAPGIS